MHLDLNFPFLFKEVVLHVNVYSPVGSPPVSAPRVGVSFCSPPCGGSFFHRFGEWPLLDPRFAFGIHDWPACWDASCLLILVPCHPQLCLLFRGFATFCCPRSSDPDLGELPFL